MRRIKNAVAANGEYTDKDGNVKTRWIQCGGLLEKDNGDLVLKLDSVPIGNTFEGWINFFDIEDSKAINAGKSQGNSLKDDKIPF
mgnify:CR=1 FL=1|tara:strand:+ start:21141 stop:21395 length:255 start_codon:yes stop_codon:yes gene_type:complete